MSKLKKVFLGLLLFIIAAITPNIYLNQLIKDKIEQLPKHINILYSSYQLNSFTGSVHFKDVELKIKDKKTGKLAFKLSSLGLEINNLSYIKLIKNNFYVENVVLNTPKLFFFTNSNSKANNAKPLNLKAKFNVELVKINNGEITYVNDKAPFFLLKI